MSHETNNQSSSASSAPRDAKPKADSGKEGKSQDVRKSVSPQMVALGQDAKVKRVVRPQTVLESESSSSGGS